MLYSRREFGKLALAGPPMAAAAARAKISSVVSGVQLGCISYSYRDMGLDAAIQAMVEAGIGECELFMGHVEPSGTSRGAERREELRQWRLTVSMDEFKAVRRKFDDAGIMLSAYTLNMNDSFSDEEIDRGFEMTKALGLDLITASATLTSAKRIAPFADKHKIQVAMHGHDNIDDPNQFAKPEAFEQACAMSKYFSINLDAGHFVAAGYDPIDYLKKNHARIPILHIKDRKKNRGPNMPWGQGDTPIKEILRLVRDNRWRIPCNVEYEYRGTDPTPVEVKRCFDYMKAALTDA
ncbi:MAG: sugar phosphate isomerase/epimerase family protein [Bryobacteraceae bacterium]